MPKFTKQYEYQLDSFVPIACS